MKITELTENKMPHLYLDMDGVQADFFGAWAKRHGLKHYKEIAHPEDAINELAQSGPEEVYNFFRELDPLSGGQQIIQWLHKNKIPFTVLSAPLRGPYAKNSIEAKKDWLDEYNPGTSNNAIFTSKKFKYAKNGDDVNVLVDDFGRYLDGWSNAGGIAVKHEDGNTNHTISELEKIYGPYLNR
jgi:5'(3')-deoxyribonucleotidase